MKIIVENFEIECFENKLDLDRWKKENNMMGTLYDGDIYEIPQDIKSLFANNVVVSIKKQNFNDTQFIIINKK